MKKYKNKYRTDSMRLQNWDYGWAGKYFITICTKNREHYFGEIDNEKMQLSNIGVLADVFWHEIKNHAKNVILDEFVVMPNHIHGILILTENNKNADGNINDDADDNADDNVDGNADDDVETRHALSLPSQSSQPLSSPSKKTIGQKRFQNPGKNNVSSIFGSYKSAVTKHAHRLGYDFEWQAKFYDHIIRNEKSYHRIKNYIKNNPKNWEDDKFYTK